jgi:Sulfotransferase family
VGEARTLPTVPLLVGCRRSGTTLLRVMFDANAQLAMPLEAYFPIHPRASWLDADGSLDTGRALAQLRRARWFAKLRLGDEALDAIAEDRAIVTYPDLLRALYRSYARAQGKPRYGDKTPRHVIFIPELAQMFPEARFVHIVRDGRDVALSLLEVDKEIPDLRTAARFWRDRVMKAREDGRALGGDRYIEVRYEDLLDDAEGELRRLCSFVDLPYDDAMPRYYERIPEMIIGTGEHRKLSKPPTKGLRDWRQALSAGEAAAFDAVAGSALDAFGYERAAVPASRGARLRVMASDGAMDLRRSLASMRRGGNDQKARRG